MKLHTTECRTLKFFDNFPCMHRRCSSCDTLYKENFKVSLTIVIKNTLEHNIDSI